MGETDELCAVCVSEEREIQKAQRLAEIEHQRKIIQETFPLEPRKPLDIHSISFEDAVYLLAFVRIGASEDLSYFGPLSAVTQPLSPTESYNVEIVRQLFKNGLLIIHPMTPPDVFIFENGEPVSMGLPQVYWALTTGNDVEATRQLVIKLETTLRTKEWWPYRWHDQRLQLWRKVALNECLEYLAVVLKEHQLPLNFGEKTLLVVTELLESYSVGQAYNMIWRAGRDAAAFYMRERVAKQHAANTVVGSIQRQVDRARVERWELKPFKRDRRCPQSMVSQVLFNVALQIGQVGFDETPKLDD